MESRQQNQAAARKTTKTVDQVKADFPLQGKFLSESLVYQAEVTENDGNEMNLIGTTADTCKKRYSNYNVHQIISKPALRLRNGCFKNLISIKWTI